MRTVRNPVIGGSHPDPGVCRAGHDYYLVCSSFECFPGGTFPVTADSLAGRWSDPVWIDLHGVVPDLAWSEDGKCWCTTSDGRTVRIDPYRGTVLEGPWRDMRDRFIAAGFPSGIGMLVDTSRNGWGGPNRPSGASGSLWTTT